MAASKHRPNSPAMPATTTPSTAQATPVANPPHHPPSSSAHLQPSNSAQQTASSGAQNQGQVTATPAPPTPASTIRELRPRPVPQVVSGRAPATGSSSASAAAPQRKSAPRKSQTSKHRNANAKRVTQPILRRSRRIATISRHGVLRAGTRHGRRGGTPSTPIRRGRRDWAPSKHGIVTRSRGSVTRTYQQMEAEAEREVRRASRRRRAWRRRREEEREFGGSGEGGGAKRARVQQVMRPRSY